MNKNGVEELKESMSFEARFVDLSTSDHYLSLRATVQKERDKLHYNYKPSAINH